MNIYITRSVLGLFVAIELSVAFKFNKNNDCEPISFRLTGLIHLVCRNLANTNETLRTSCTDCFLTAINVEQPSVQILTCATNYLTNTHYNNCITFDQISDNMAGSGPCPFGYCQFIRCIRSVNANLLISRCYNESMENNSATDQIALYKNVTSCILGIVRCSEVNPITGENQTNTFTATRYNKWGLATTTTEQYYNSLQITPSGDLRIIAFPSTLTAQPYFCSERSNLDQSVWRNYTC